MTFRKQIFESGEKRAARVLGESSAWNRNACEYRVQCNSSKDSARIALFGQIEDGGFQTSLEC